MGILSSIGNIAKGIEGFKDGKGEGLKGRLKGIAANVSGEKQDDMLTEILSNQEKMLATNNFGSFNEVGKTLSGTGDQGSVTPAIGSGKVVEVTKNADKIEEKLSNPVPVPPPIGESSIT
jgi:hypothetical protein